MLQSKIIKKLLTMVKVATFSSISTVLASTSDIMDKASISASISSQYASSAIDGGYNNRIKAEVASGLGPDIPDGSSEITLILDQPSTIVTLFINNYCYGKNVQQGFGETQILMGNDSSTWST